MPRKIDGEDEGNREEMSKGIFEKVLNAFGFEAEEVMEEDEYAATYDESLRRDYREKERGREQNREREREREREPKLVSLANSSKSVKMIISDPSTFDDVQTIVDHLKNRRAVILNLEETDKAVARRIADFMSGAVYAMEGTMQKVSGSIFLFTPPNIEVSAPLRSELKEKERNGTSTFSSSSSFFRNNDRER